MKRRSLTILNIGLDRELLSRDTVTEALTRQLYYATHLPARIVHIIKAPSATSPDRIEVGNGLSILPCPVRHWVSFVTAAARLGSRLMRESTFDLIQVQEPFLSGIAGRYLASRSGTPLVVGLFSDEIDNPLWLAERPIHHLANFFGKRVLRHAAAIRCDSQAVVDRLSHYGWRNLTYIPFLITHAERFLTPSPQAAEIRSHLLDGAAGPLLLAVSRLEAEKNIPLMLAALSEAAKVHTGLVLAIAGAGRLADDLKRQAETIVPGRVRWLGWIGHDALPAYLQAADLSLLSSNRESAARVLYESLLAGTPVLTTDTAGAREVVEDGVTGRIVPIGDTAAYAHALIELCDDPVRLCAMGRLGSRRVQSKVTADAVIGRLRAMYDAALGWSA